ncbi:D-Ala-D-Ala carboxypeptidase family metallohydrolase [Asticcacaulis sp. AC402]|uniref:D-Ala-D-Ala carboxypeptidase family metallohydrolase n=1 Tax=Asticcacaulis sp. AC402 TaxID=1282361 RepID=UPI0003C401AB|nr:D-Ala-D-Ala carboxypeptidase family metallohydrolase [Asticcacaulis sp. AC402]ESQ76103.1 hypothetical protein ABAC402_06550 [Asticcacaulis sp. AC402]
MKRLIIAIAGCLVGLSASAAATPEGDVSEAAYQAWVTDNRMAAQVQAFEAHLASNGVAGVLPTYQILRTSSRWQACKATAFELPPRELWPNVLPVLRYIRTEVEPRIGRVQAVSGYRNPELNGCSGGAKQSAHRNYFALDLVPEAGLSRGELIKEMCQVHRDKGQKGRIGLGFYSGVRFHLDSKRYRTWGADGTGATSPCNGA